MSEGRYSLPAGVTTRTVETPRPATHLLESGPESGILVLFIHGNVSSSLFFDDTLAALPDRYNGLAPDLRGYGGSGTAPLDAYAANGGTYREEAIPDCGHTPHVESPEEFRYIVFGFLGEHEGGTSP